MITHSQKLNKIQQELEALISSSKSLDEKDIAYFQAIRNLIDFKLNEDEVKSYFTEVNEVLTSMAQLNFSKRVKVENTKDLFSYLGASINLVNEELEGEILYKNLHTEIVENILGTKADHIITLDGFSLVTYVDEKLCDLLNYNIDDLIGKNISNILSCESVSLILDSGLNVKEKEVSLVVRKSKEYIPMKLTVKKIKFAKGSEFKIGGFLYLLKQN